MEYFLCFLFLHDGERVCVVLCLRESLPLCKLLEVVIEDSHHVDSSDEQNVSNSLEKRGEGEGKGEGEGEGEGEEEGEGEGEEEGEGEDEGEGEGEGE